MTQMIVKVALDTPLLQLFDYFAPANISIGTLVSVPFGRQLLTGIVVEINASSIQPIDKIRPVEAICQAIPCLSRSWLELCRFASQYYLRPVGEVMLPAIPNHLRNSKRWTKLEQQAAKEWPQLQTLAPSATPSFTQPVLSNAQQKILETLDHPSHVKYAPFLLHGVTGSGKTEIYLRFIAQRLAQDTNSQILLLVPEINLTPQLETELKQRFPTQNLAVLHSGLAEGQRAKYWLAAHLGKARIVLGTRLAVLASLPHLAAIVIDEEHDPSYKQQEGLRYSARDLAVWRAHQLNIPIILGSATPSLESWWHSTPNSQRYTRLSLPQRAQENAVLPTVRIVDLKKEKQLKRASENGLSAPLLEAISIRLQKGEQSLLYLNRRGYAPVLNCSACGWLSGCTRCSTNLVLHRQLPSPILRCHHCGLEKRVPKHCPDCGNADLHPLGRGTQRIEETLTQLFPTARIIRIDADSTRRKGQASALLNEVHTGKADILIGTQMVSKGHDFQRVTLVGILNPDTSLHSHYFRSEEQLFAQLMQVAGRAGRAELPGEVILQTDYPHAEIYAALQQHDYPHFADTLLAQRQAAALPPFSFHALLTVEAKTMEACLAFLQQARDQALHLPDCLSGIVSLLDPVPRPISKVANREHAQLLIESLSRPALQRTLTLWISALQTLKPKQKWLIERDPYSV